MNRAGRGRGATAGGRDPDAHARAIVGHVSRARYGSVAEDIARELARERRGARMPGIAATAHHPRSRALASRSGPSTVAALVGLPALSALGRPLLAGPSRKSFLKSAVGDVPPAERDVATAAAVTASALLGAHIVRVHARAGWRTSCGCPSAEPGRPATSDN